MPKLVPAKMTAKFTLRNRNKKFNQAKRAAIKDIKYQEYSFSYLTIAWSDVT